MKFRTEYYQSPTLPPRRILEIGRWRFMFILRLNPRKFQWGFEKKAPGAFTAGFGFGMMTGIRRNFAALALLSVFLALPACTPTGNIPADLATFNANAAKIGKADNGTPQQAALIEDGLNAAINITLDALGPQKTQVIPASVTGIASVLNDVKNLPSNTSSATIQSNLTTATANTPLNTKFAGAMANLIDGLKQKGVPHKTAVTTALQGFQKATSAVSQVAAIGN